MVQRSLDVGAITYKYQVLGATNISTSDEKNIQAMLATQFADFGELIISWIWNILQMYTSIQFDRIE